MMKVSDPIIFGHVVKAYFADVFDEVRRQDRRGGPDAQRRARRDPRRARRRSTGGDEIAAAITADLERGPRLSYTNSDKGLTNLHVPSDVIVDASMPALIRNGGKLWGVDGGEDDTLAVIPDSSYAERLPDGHRRRERPRPARPRHDRHRCPTSASWRRRPRSTAATTRRSRSRRPASCRCSTAPATCSSSTTCSRATSGAPPRRRTSRSATG